MSVMIGQFRSVDLSFDHYVVFSSFVVLLVKQPSQSLKELSVVV